MLNRKFKWRLNMFPDQLIPKSNSYISLSGLDFTEGSRIVPVVVYFIKKPNGEKQVVVTDFNTKNILKTVMYSMPTVGQHNDEAQWLQVGDRTDLILQFQYISTSGADQAKIHNIIESIEMSFMLEPPSVESLNALTKYIDASGLLAILEDIVVTIDNM